MNRYLVGASNGNNIVPDCRFRAFQIVQRVPTICSSEETMYQASFETPDECPLLKEFLVDFVPMSRGLGGTYVKDAKDLPCPPNIWDRHYFV